MPSAHLSARTDDTHDTDRTSIWRRLDDLPERIDDARPWLFGVARATMLNHRRGERRRDALAVRIADLTARNGSPAQDEESANRLDLAVAWGRLSSAEVYAALREAQQVVVRRLEDGPEPCLARRAGVRVGWVWEGLRSAQAGIVLGCSATAYRLRLARARRSLRRHLDSAPSSTPPATVPAKTQDGLQR